MSKIEEMRELMHNIVQSLHNRSPRYHYKLTGDEPECLSRLLELDEAGMHHLLDKCEPFDDKSKKIKMSGVVDQHDMFDCPCYWCFLMYTFETKMTFFDITIRSYPS
jgi:hypothetical protein